MTDRIVILGGGVAADSCAFELRKQGFDGAVTVVGAEPHRPYDRTLLSKEFLGGLVGLGDLALRAPQDYEAAGIGLRLGVAAVGLDVHGRRVLLADGSEVAYHRLVVATGGTPARPPALDHPDVLVLRSPADANALRAAIERGGRVIVVGAGFIGGEVASAVAASGGEVALVEAFEAPLARAVGPAVGRRIAALLRARGVELSTGVAARAVRRRAGGLEVALADGRTLRGDAVVVGAGMVPDVGWLRGSGVALDRGVVTDARCRTNVDEILAAGDCARWWNPRYEMAMRVEHWDTAARHGAAAARSALGAGAPFAPVPFFWSVQHGVRLQCVGHPAGWDVVEVDDLDPPQSFVARYQRDGRLLATFAAGNPRAVASARRRLEAEEEEILA